MVNRNDRLVRGLLVAGRACCLGWVVISLGGCAPRLVNYTPTPAPAGTPVPTPTPIRATAVALPTPTPAVEEDVGEVGPTLLRIAPPMINVQVGETRPVEILLDNAEQLHTLEVHVSYEPGYVNVEDADPDAEGIQIEPGVMPRPGEIVVNEVNNQAGLILYHVVRGPDQMASRSGTVASFTVRALAEGGSPLRFNVVRLLDADGQSLEISTQVDGLVSIGAADGTGGGTPGGATPAPTAGPATGEPPAVTVPPTVPASPSPPVAPSPAPSAETGVYYTVQPGENLFRIALRYGTTVDAIVSANGLANENAIQAGQTILIPVSPSAGQVTYVVQKGDTLFSIARRFDKTVDELAALNGIDSSYTIAVGQTLIIVP